MPDPAPSRGWALGALGFYPSGGWAPSPPFGGCVERCVDGASVAGAAARPLPQVARCLDVVFKEEKWFGSVSRRFVLSFGPRAGRHDEASLGSRHFSLVLWISLRFFMPLVS